MVVYNNILAGAAGQGGAAEYVIPKSLRFNSGDSAHLSKTFASAGNRRTWTWSGWVKRAKLGDDEAIFSGGASNPITTIRFGGEGSASPDGINIFHYAGSFSFQLTTTAQYRDLSSWYHIVVACDTTQATASNRLKLYVNGEQVTAFDTETYPSQNFETEISNTSTQTIARNGTGSNYKNGYLADIQFVDGQQLAPTDFGETRSSDGVWVPKEFAGSYTLNPDGYNQVWSDGVAGSNQVPNSQAFDGDLTTWAAPNGSSTLTWTPSATLTVSSSMRVYAARESSSDSITVNFTDGSSFNSFTGDNVFRWYTVTSPAGKTVSNIVWTHTTDKSKISAIEIDGQILTDASGKNSFHLNFSDSSTNEALGFDSAPTTPDPDPKKGMDVITYTGNGGTQNVGGALFEPGLIWIKNRDSSRNHYLYDSIRGAGTSGDLASNGIVAENTLNTEVYGYLSAFNPDGFTVVDGSNSTGNFNSSSQDYVAWTWRAGGPAVSNTDGTITSQVSANTDYGFSIVTYTNPSSGTFTVGHGLGANVGMIITKHRNRASDWYVWHKSFTSEDDYINLNSTAAKATAGDFWGTSAPGGSTFGGSIGTSALAGDTDVAYVWSEVSGYSKFGTYSGTGSAVKVTTGFEPRFILVRSTSSGREWLIWDSERGASSGALRANSSGTAYSDSTYNGITFDSDGFTIMTGDSTPNMSASGEEYIFAAFADRPGNNWDVNNIVTSEGLTTSKTQFDVVTYTGNGGTSQRIGAKLSSGTISGDGTPANASGSGGWAQAFDGNTSNLVYVSGGTGTVTSKLTLPVALPFTKLRIYAGQNATSGTNIQANDVNLSASHTWTLTGSWVDVTSSVTSPLTSLALTTVNGNSSNIRAIEIDDQIVIEGDGTSLNFQPDFIWLKNRSSAYSHTLYDSIRGVGIDKALASNTNGAEGSLSDGTTFGYVNSLNSDGFTVTKGSDSTSYTNGNNQNYVAWCWKAGGTAVSNTDGSVTSSVSANPAYGFSVVTYTGTGSAATVGHGLNGKVPELIIVKNRDKSYNWAVWSSQLSSNAHYLFLNSTDGQSNSYYTFWNNTAPTGSVFSVGANSPDTAGAVNENGDDMVAYCFANVPGYQRVGSYVGNGSTTGPVVVTGFKPRFLLIKNTSLAGSNWFIFDSERSPSNPVKLNLKPNSSAAEETDSSGTVDFNQNGFQIKSAGTHPNGSGNTIIYLAIGDDEIGSDEDCLVDVPNAVTADADATDTTGGYQRGNYCTMNPLASTTTLTNGNLHATMAGYPGDYGRGTIAMTSGKWYFEWTKISGSEPSAGVSTDSTGAGGGYVYHGNGYLYPGGITGAGTLSVGDVIGVATDATAGSVAIYKNGVLVHTFTGITADTFYPFYSGTNAGTSVVAFNFGQMRFKYPIPSGYAALNTTALPAATIPDGSKYFDAVTYTSDGQSSKKLTFGFSPDLFWSKVRNFAEHHVLHDSVRGASKVLKSSNTDAESTEASNRGVLSFDSDGVTIGIGSPYNSSGNNSVVWAWDAGSSTVSNTDGSITSSVRANQTAGFSVVTFTGTGANATIGHGLNAEPHALLTKCRESGFNWAVYFKGKGNGGRFMLNNTLAFATSSTFWNNTTPTSSVFSVGSFFASGNTFVAYCISPVLGYSAVGSYTGNGNADGPFVNTSMRPRWIMIRGDYSGGDWLIVDTERVGIGDDNVATGSLAANLNNNEAHFGANNLDILSNGFKIRSTNSVYNTSGTDYYYIAFAENPFSANGGLAR
jgi:hypothetical protein